jgi:FKBP-type peptidyl-prolyl cis-trans isomerase FkpA
MSLRVAPGLALLALAALLAGPAVAQEPKSEQEKTIYALGLAVARNLQVFDLTPEEVKLVAAGLTAGLTHQKPAVELEAYEAKLDPLAEERRTGRAAKERAASGEFLVAAEKEKGARKLPSGLIYRETQAGKGANPTPQDDVKVHYVGKLRDGKVFDSSRERGEPAVFPLPRLVPCWKEGLLLMKPGGKAIITCPSELAYGDTGVPPGSGDRIPPGAALQFDVELIGIEKPKPTTPPPSQNPKSN